MSVLALHSKMNGPYDNTVCRHCTTMLISIAEVCGSPEPYFVEYPCDTVKAYEEENNARD